MPTRELITTYQSMFYNFNIIILYRSKLFLRTDVHSYCWIKIQLFLHTTKSTDAFRFRLPYLLAYFSRGYESVILRWVTTQNLFRIIIWTLRFCPSTLMCLDLHPAYLTIGVEGTRILYLSFLNSNCTIKNTNQFPPSIEVSVLYAQCVTLQRLW